MSRIKREKRIRGQKKKERKKRGMGERKFKET